MIKKILLAVVAVIVLFLIIVALQSEDYVVTRSITIAASPDKVFPQVNELKKWDAWSPWAKIDPNAKITFDGPEGGTGAIMKWVGNSQVGEGKMTLTENRTNEMIRFKLEFYKPMAGVSDSEFTFKPEGAQTSVTWSMSGKKDFLSKAICMFMSMDKMLGGQFETGLSQMKSVVENPAKK